MNQYTKGIDECDWYNISHAYGQLRFWREIAKQDNEILNMINGRKEYLIEINALSEELMDIFEWNKFCDFCDVRINELIDNT